MIDLEKLRSFYYVIKEGSLLKAANALNKNHTTLSKHLTDLEQSYGIKLFVRKHKRLELTEKGEELFTLAQNTIPNLEDGAADILNPESPSSPTNRLRIITTSGVIGVWVVQKVGELMKEFPDLRPSIITTTADFDFENSKADVGVGPKPRPGFSAKRIKTLHPGLYASPQYIEKHGEVKNLDDLENHQLVSYYSDNEGNLGNIDWHLTRGLPNNTMRKSRLAVNSAFLIFEAARQGIGIIPMAKEFEYLSNSSLINILPEESGPNLEVYFIRRANVVLTHTQKRFQEILAE